MKQYTKSDFLNLSLKRNIRMIVEDSISSIENILFNTSLKYFKDSLESIVLVKQSFHSDEEIATLIKKLKVLANENNFSSNPIFYTLHPN